MAEESQWKHTIEEALSGLNEAVQHLRVDQQARVQASTEVESRARDVRRQPQRFAKGDDPSIYLIHFEAIANDNRWDHHRRASAFPTYLHPGALQWFNNLEAPTKRDFNLIKTSFIRRYQGANDRHKLEQDFANIRFNQFSDLESYADRLEDIGAKLGKTAEEVVRKFVVGLPDAAYRWVNNMDIGDLGDALEYAHQGLVLFPPRNGKSHPTERFPRRWRQEGWREPREESRPQQEPVEYVETRREEPMEFRHRGFGQSRGRGRGNGRFHDQRESSSYPVRGYNGAHGGAVGRPNHGDHRGGWTSRPGQTKN